MNKLRAFISKIFLAVFLCLSFYSNGQTLETIFSGYGDINSVSGSGPTYTLNIAGFQGTYHSFNDGFWSGFDCQIGDVVWFGCQRAVITTINSSGSSYVNVTVTVPSEDWALGISPPTNGTRVAVVREIENKLPGFPPPADGNAGALAGIPGTLFSCMLNHYIKQVNKTTLAEEVACVSGSGAPSNSIATSLGYRLAINNGCSPTTGVLYVWNSTAGAWQTAGTGGLSSLANGKIIIGDISNLPQEVTPSGDATITNAGVITVDKIDNVQVQATGASNGQVLKWNNSLSKWEPGADNTGGAGSDGTVSSATYDPTTNEVTLNLTVGGPVTYTHKDLKYNNGPLTGSASGYSVGLDYSTGRLYYNNAGTWSRFRITDVNFTSVTTTGNVTTGTQQINIGTLTGNIVLTLFTCNSTNSGQTVKFFKSGTDSFSVEITGGQTFTDGQTSKFLYSAGTSFECTCNGTNWYYSND